MAETEKHRDKYIAIDRMKERDKVIQRKRGRYKGERDKEIEVKINTEKEKQRGQNRDQETKSFRKGQREGLYYSLAHKVYPSFPHQVLSH